MNYSDLATALAFDMIGEEDAILLMLEETMNPKVSPHHNYCVDRFTESEFENLFRFKKEHIAPLVKALRLDNQYCSQNGIKWSAEEGLCLFLRRISYPNRLVDLIPIFGRHITEMSTMINIMTDEIYSLHHSRLENINHPWMNFEQYTEVVAAKGACLDNIWGFIDGTQVRICRPNKGQESCFNGHKHQHSLKFQSLMLPNGIIGHFFGPLEGRRHDSAMYFNNGLDPQIQNIYSAAGKQLAVYADSAYAFCRYLIVPFKGANLGKMEKKFNKNMSEVRTSVEWGFSKMSNIFGFLDFHKNLKVYLQPIAKLVMASVILTNAHTCLYSSQTSKYFGLEPPSLQAYFY